MRGVGAHNVATGLYYCAMRMDCQRTELLEFGWMDGINEIRFSGTVHGDANGVFRDLTDEKLAMMSIKQVNRVAKELGLDQQTVAYLKAGRRRAMNRQYGRLARQRNAMCNQ